MNTVRERKTRPLEKVPTETTPAEANEQLDLHVEAEGRLREQAEDGKLKRWKEKALMSTFLLATVILCGAWAVVFLSGQFSPEDKKQVTDMFDKLIFALLGILAGKGMKS